MCLFMNNPLYFSLLPRRATRPPQPFFKNKKNCPDFRKKGPDWVHPYVQFIIQNVVLRVFKRKTPKFFPVGLFFSGIFNEMFIEVA